MNPRSALTFQRRWRSCARQLAASDGLWCYSREARDDDPAAGWKIHVSATPLSANAIFSRVWPILRKRDSLFKVVARLEFLADLNVGRLGFSQVGKFLTVYPRSTQEAVKLAQALHSATQGLHGPEIPFDAHYRRKSIVFYRYGSFRQDRVNHGTVVDHKGKLRLDRRECPVPEWLSDPFAKPSLKTKRQFFGGTLAPDYLVIRALSQRGKGGVYEAVDLSASPARLVIVKEGRLHGETLWNGEDGYSRVKREGKVLRALCRAGIGVPKVLREFQRDGNRFVVLEKITARSLLARNRKQPRAPSITDALRILDRLGPVLEKIHAAGWVWRDCKPRHLFGRRGLLHLIDFEGACALGETDLPPWGSPEYVPPIYRNKFSRRPGTLEDDYALGVVAFQFMCGEFPPVAGQKRAAFYRRAGCPDSLRDRIEELLRH